MVQNERGPAGARCSHQARATSSGSGKESAAAGGRAPPQAEAATDADCVVIGTAHKEFKDIDVMSISRLVRTPAALVDSRNVVDPASVERVGMAYRGVGRPAKGRRPAPVELEGTGAPIRLGARASSSPSS